MLKNHYWDKASDKRHNQSQRKGTYKVAQVFYIVNSKQGKTLA